MKVRVRVGIRLGWPIFNAATFVVYLSEAKYAELAGAIVNVKAALTTSGDEKAILLASRLFCERS